MSETRESHSRTGAIVAILIFAMVALPLLYVLSVGPATWLAARGYVDLESIRPFYWPIIALHDACPPLQPALQTYVAFFES